MLRRFIVLSLLTLWCLPLAACEGCGGDAEGTTSTETTGASEPPEDLPPFAEIDGIDTSEFEGDSPERRLYWAAVNSQTSPCGEPVSVAECVQDDAIACGQCRGAAAYLVRLAASGATRPEMTEAFRLRYAEDTTIEVDIDEAQIRGAVMAPITIVVFSDFECPFCGMAHPALTRVLARYEGQVRLAFKHYPLSMHQHAGNAALAAEAAGAQGKFWEMHDMLFEHQTALENEDIFRYAAEVGLDMERFRADLSSEELQGRVNRSKAEGQRIGVDSTPTIIINGRAYDGDPRSAGRAG